jgi:sulfate adenylyltransferase subunit 1
MTITEGYFEMDLMRFITAGSVDDGKSTLIGRLLFDSKAIFSDQLETLEIVSKRRGDEHLNLALLTDGLRAEREQGITIDVAYRYFITPKREFIIADTPGHIQYTRNMITGASTANVALILVDARNGIVEQTIRHAFIASLLRIPHIILCINKMDLVGYDDKVYEKIRIKFDSISAKLDVHDICYVPISALKGDNVVERSKIMTWYNGPTLMYLLENLHISSDQNHSDARFPVQIIIRPNTDEFHDYRGYAGRVAGGVFNKGDKVIVLPSGIGSVIKSIDIFKSSVNEAFVSQSVTLQLEDDIDISRGDMIVKPDNLPQIKKDIELMVCWLNEKPFQSLRKYIIRHTSNEAKCEIKEIVYKINIDTLEKDYLDKALKMNEIALIKIKVNKPLIFDSYKNNKVTGSLIIIDESTNETVGAGMIL